MRSTTLLPLILSGAAVALPVTQWQAEANPAGFPRPCAPLHIMVARGTCDSGAISDHFGEGGFYQVAEMITSKVDGANSFGLMYPATGLPACPAPAYLESEAMGVELLVADITNYVTRCPNSKVALVGYSQGGQVIGDVLCGASSGDSTNEPLSSDIADHIIAAIIFGDPGYKAGESYNVNTAVTGNGIFPRTSTASCPTFSNKLQSYCNVGDPICSGGDNMQAHWSYVSSYGAEGASYVLEKYRESL